MYGYYRGLGAGSQPIREGNLLYALELLHDDGPWKQPDHFKKINGVLRYSLGDDAFGGSAHGLGLRREVGLDRSDRAARARRAGFRALRFARRQRRRQLAEVHVVWRVAPARRRLGQPGRALRLLSGPRSVVELHLPARQSAGRPVQAVRPALGGRRLRPPHLVRRRCSTSRWRTASACSCAATASTTACNRPWIAT